MTYLKIVPVVLLLALVAWIGLRKADSGIATAALSKGALAWLEKPDQDMPEFVEPWDEPGRRPDRIALTWSDDPATTLSVTWRTDTTVAQAFAMVTRAEASPNLADRADTVKALVQHVDLSKVDGEYVRAHFHSVTFKGLRPGTLYAYRVGDGELWSEWFHARTADREPNPFSFIYFGDAQNDLHNLWSRSIRAAFTQASDARFMIHAGDLVNRAHRNTEWGEWFEAGNWLFGMIPSIPVPGNHEYGGYGAMNQERRLSALWRPQFTLPENGLAGLKETNYFIDYQGLRIVGLNSNTMIEEQTAWLDNVLSDNPNTWTIATFHHPVFSSSGGRDNPELRKHWRPVIEKHQVDLVFQGHDHTYARGRVLNVPTGSNVRSPVSGTVYVNSVSGPKMYEIKEDRWDGYGAEMERAAENTQLFQVIDIAADTLWFEARTVTGELYDAFKLVKSESGPNDFVSLVDPGEPERRHSETTP